MMTPGSFRTAYETMGYTQEDYAAVLGCTERSIRTYATVRVPWTIALITRLLKRGTITPEQLAAARRE